MKNFRRFMAVAICLLLAGTGGGCGVDKKIEETLNPPVADKTPVARISASAETVTISNQVKLDGTSSSDPQGSSLTYAWTISEKPTQSSTALSSSTDSIVTFLADKGGYYTVTLVVTNASSTPSATASVRINATGTGDNHPPVADVGDAQKSTVGDTVVLDGSASYDIDNDELSYTWAVIESPTHSSASLSNKKNSHAYLYTDVAGTYKARLTVSDGYDSDTAYVTVTASKGTKNNAPVADAGTDTSATTDTLVVLDGTSSYDVDGDTLTYAWTMVSKPSDSEATLTSNSSTTSKSSFTPDTAGTYYFRLRVSDGTTTTDAFVTITVTASS